MKRKFLLIIAILAMALSFWSTSSPALELDGQRFSKIQAAYLLNFAKFISWPKAEPHQPDTPFIIGVYGNSAFNDHLQALGGKIIHNRTIVVRRVSALKQTQNCQLLFISPTAKKNLPGLLSFLQGKPVVTVSTLPGFARQGGTIELMQRGDNIHFSINTKNSKASGLTIPSQVLALAVEVLEEKP